MQDSGSLAVFKVTARDQGHYKGPSGHSLHTVTFLVLIKQPKSVLPRKAAYFRSIFSNVVELIALLNFLMHVGRYKRLLSHSKGMEAFPRTCSSFCPRKKMAMVFSK